MTMFFLNSFKSAWVRIKSNRGAHIDNIFVRHRSVQLMKIMHL
jgi:hypothetical protein